MYTIRNIQPDGSDILVTTITPPERKMTVLRDVDGNEITITHGPVAQDVLRLSRADKRLTDEEQSAGEMWLAAIARVAGEEHEVRADAERESEAAALRERLAKLELPK